MFEKKQESVIEDVINLFLQPRITANLVELSDNNCRQINPINPIKETTALNDVAFLFFLHKESRTFQNKTGKVSTFAPYLTVYLKIQTLKLKI